MELTTVVGMAAGFLTTVAFVPQAAKIWKTRSAKDLSLPAFSVFTLGVALWLGYGVLKQELPIIVWNAVTLAIAGAILAMKRKFG